MRRHRFIVLIILGALGSLVTALSPHWHDMRTKHSWRTVPHGWEWVGHPPNGTTINLYVALKSHRENALIDALYEVSTPEHLKQVFSVTPSYGQHLSKEQVAELVAPHPDTLNLVHSWLDYNGIPSSSISSTHGGNSLKLTGVPLSQANDLLGASYQAFKHVTTNETIVRTTGYALPAVLHELVKTVVPTTSFDSPRQQWQKSRKSYASDGAEVRPNDVVSGEPVKVPPSREFVDVTTPSFLSWLYSTWVYSPVATGRSRLGIVGYLQQYPNLQDLRLFMRKYRSQGAGAIFTVLLINDGLYDPNNAGYEASLDMQYAQGMAYPIQHIFYSTGLGPKGTDDVYLSFLEIVINDPNIPQTISLSYGNNETDYPIDYADHVCRLFAQLGARGVSVIQASGNQGVGHGNCRDGFGNVFFLPQFPATCPWVTTVGGTKNYRPEIASTVSGGGFSNIFLRPPYQDRDVNTFLQNLGTQYRGLYNPDGRGIPDISAQAEGFKIFRNGREESAAGTSGAAPIVAGIFSLLNDNRISQGKAPRGFLNPWLYKTARKGFTDIKQGSNPGCGTLGFLATVGWDPVTGLGTPDFEQLLYIDDLV
ncbi:peptidase S8/S53 domain-containing protein [Lactarius quietus]|nr:peptidase S8/S53 domain-containing protein [Lactarius quietus]